MCQKIQQAQIQHVTAICKNFINVKSERLRIGSVRFRTKQFSHELSEHTFVNSWKN